MALPAVAQVPTSTLYILTDNNELATTTLNAPENVSTPLAIAGLLEGDKLVALDVRPQNQKLYALGVNSDNCTIRLYHITPSLNAPVATPVGLGGTLSTGEATIYFSDTTWSMDFNPATDTLRVVNQEDDLNFRMNPNRGTLVDSSEDSGNNPDGYIHQDNIHEFEPPPHIWGIAHTNNQPNSGTVTTLYTLQVNSGTLNIQNSPDSGKQTQQLQVRESDTALNFTSVGGFDIVPGTNADESNGPVSNGVAYAVLRVGETSKLYQIIIDPTAAGVNALGDLNAISIAVRTSLSSAVGLSSEGMFLTRFDPLTEDQIYASLITGVAESETMVAVAMRPSTGQLYGLGVNPLSNTATLYILEPLTGIAYPVGTPGQIAYLDKGGNAIPLPATPLTYDMSINPVTDELRMVNGNLNLRVSMAGTPIDGDYGEDTPITGNNPDGPINIEGTPATAKSIAYRYSLDDAESATLYSFNADNHSLNIQSPENQGSQNYVAELTDEESPINYTLLGLDIPVGSPNGYFFANKLGAVFLFKVDLATGAINHLRGTNYGYYAGLAVFAIAEAPSVAVADAENVTNTGATLSGRVTEDGGQAVTRRGFVYNLKSSQTTPVIGGNGVTELIEQDEIAPFDTFSEDASGLSQSTTYTYRAYAENKAGITYSETAEFTTVNPASVDFEDVAVGGVYDLEIPLAEGNTITAKGLPPGLKLNSRTGVITGRASTPGVYQVIITVTAPGNVKSTSINTFTVQALPRTAVGTFVGYVETEESGVTEGMGGRLDVTTTTKGSFTVKLTRARTTLSKTGFLTSNLVDAPEIETTLSDGTSIDLSLTASNTVEGGVFLGPHAANVVGWRKTFDRVLFPASEQMGYYTVAILNDPGDFDNADVPKGSGFATILIGVDGSYKLVGKAADGSAITTSAFLGTTGQMMVFSPVYSKAGSISAFLSLKTHADGNYADNSIDGTLHLNKTVTTGRAYKAALTNVLLEVQGMYMARAASGGFVLGLPSSTSVSSLVFSEGGIDDTNINPSLYGGISFSAATLKATVPTAGSISNPTRTALTLKAASGSFTGSFKLVDGSLTRTVTYQGMLVRMNSGDTIASGYFLLPQIPGVGQTIRNSPILSGRVQWVNGNPSLVQDD